MPRPAKKSSASTATCRPSDHGSTRAGTPWNRNGGRSPASGGPSRCCAPIIQTAGLVALVVVLLGFCWYALVAIRRGDDTDAELNELLICEVLPDEPQLLTGNQHAPPLLSQSQPDDRSA